MCKNWITGDASKFHIGVSDNAANVTLALNSAVILDAPPELRDRALTDTEGSDGYDKDDVTDAKTHCEQIITKTKYEHKSCFPSSVYICNNSY